MPRDKQHCPSAVGGRCTGARCFVAVTHPRARPGAKMAVSQGCERAHARRKSRVHKVDAGASVKCSDKAWRQRIGGQTCFNFETGSGPQMPAKHSLRPMSDPVRSTDWAIRHSIGFNTQICRVVVRIGKGLERGVASSDGFAPRARTADDPELTFQERSPRLPKRASYRADQGHHCTDCAFKLSTAV